MSRFEYLSRLAIGHHMPTGSVLYRLDPRARILSYVFLTLALTLSRLPAALLIAPAALLVLLKLAELPWKHTVRGLLAPLPFILFLALLQLFITPRPEGDTLYFSWHFLIVSAASVHSALLLVLRFISLVLLLTLASSTLSTLELIYGLELLLQPLQLLGIRTRPLVMVVQIMLRYIPFLLLSAEKITKAQASRGAAWGTRGGLLSRLRQFLPLILPLFNTSMQQADVLADAMLARGYGSAGKRTSLRSYQFTWVDLGVVLSCIAASVLMLLRIP